MDIYTYLKLDHAYIDHLFKQFNNSEINTRKKQIVYLIAQELTTHAESEQNTFYQALEDHLPSKKETMHGKKEHQEIKEQIHIILSEKTFGNTWNKNIQKLQDLVKHHVKEEETAIFKLARKVLSQEDAYCIKEKMHYLKKKLLPQVQKELSRRFYL